MAISIPSDLVMDVVRAADPVRQQQAAMALGKISGSRFPAIQQMADRSAVAGDIEGDGASFRDSFDLISRPAVLADAGGGVSRYQAVPVRSPVGEKFEAMMLHQFLEEMMPRDSENFYGKGTAGEIWRSMLAEQVGGQIAKSHQLELSSYFKLP